MQRLIKINLKLGEVVLVKQRSILTLLVQE